MRVQPLSYPWRPDVENRQKREIDVVDIPWIWKASSLHDRKRIEFHAVGLQKRACSRDNSLENQENLEETTNVNTSTITIRTSIYNDFLASLSLY